MVDPGKLKMHKLSFRGGGLAMSGVRPCAAGLAIAGVTRPPPAVDRSACSSALGALHAVLSGPLAVVFAVGK